VPPAAAIASSSGPIAGSGRSTGSAGIGGDTPRNRLYACRRATPNSHVVTREPPAKLPADRHTASIVS
jgi:hypothetical protein